MSKKEGLLAGSPKENTQEDDSTPPVFVNPSVTFYPQGVMLHKPVRGKGKGGTIGARGIIKGWSSASRRRMREWMLTHSAPEGWSTVGATMTIPGPELPAEDAKKLWADFSRLLQKEGWGMVWRLEIQKRGALHWHCLIIQPVCHPADVSILWLECLRMLPEVDHQAKWIDKKTGKEMVGEWQHARRSALSGASSHACDVQTKGDRGSWLRYLQDHASKGKQEQVAQDIGRHWGIVGRKLFVERLQLHKAELSDKAYARVVRAMRRLATPMRPNPSAPFGKSLSWSPRRGMYGRSVWYSAPLTIARICEWARSFDVEAVDAWAKHQADSV